jgi:hypothetical protein
VNRKVLTPTPLIAICVGLVAGVGCDDEPATTPGPHASRELVVGNDPRQLERLVESVQDDFVAGDGGRLCAKLTPAGRAEVVRFAGGDVGCAEGVNRFSGQTKSSGIEQRPANAVSVEIRGDRATVVVRERGHRLAPVHLLRQHGAWSISSLGLAQPAQPP